MTELRIEHTLQYFEEENSQYLNKASSSSVYGMLTAGSCSARTGLESSVSMPPRERLLLVAGAVTVEACVGDGAGGERMMEDGVVGELLSASDRRCHSNSRGVELSPRSRCRAASRRC